MAKRCIQPALILILAGCGASRSAGADAVSTNLPFVSTAVATFSSPWAMAFVPGGGALVTEKAGRLKWWQPGRVTSEVRGVPPVVARGQGGLLDVALSNAPQMDDGAFRVPPT